MRLRLAPLVTLALTAMVAAGCARHGSGLPQAVAASAQRTSPAPTPIVTPLRLAASPIPLELIKKSCARDPALPQPPPGGITSAEALEAWMGQRPGVDRPELVCAVAGQLREYLSAGSTYGDGAEWVWKLVWQTRTKVDTDPCGGPRACVLPAGSQVTGWVIVDYFSGKWVMAGSPAVFCPYRLNPVCYVPPGS
jgi:hypothetical protein